MPEIDSCGLAPTLVGNTEPSCTERFSICQWRPSPRTTPCASPAAMAQPPMTCALTTLVSIGFMGSAWMASRACRQLP